MRQLEIRVSWEEGKVSRSNEFVETMLRSVYLPKSIKEGQDYINYELASANRSETFNQGYFPLAQGCLPLVQGCFPLASKKTDLDDIVPNQAVFLLSGLPRYRTELH